MNGPSGPEDLLGGGAPQGQLLTPDPNLPQPPQQQGGEAIPGGTLGDVNQQMAPGNPLVDQYVQIAQALEQQLAPLKMRVQPPQPGPGLLQSLATFGIANLKHVADENTRREENYVAIKNNQALSLKAAAMAQHMVDAQAAQGAIQSRVQLAQARYITDLQDKALQEYHRQLGEAYRGTVPRATTTQGADLQEGQGLVPSRQFPGRLVPREGGGWDPPAANSPVATALGGVGGGGGGGAASTGPSPGESPQDYARRKERASKPITGQAQKDVTSIDQSVADSQEILKLAQDPEVQKWMGPMMGRVARGIYGAGGSVLGVDIPPKVSRYIQKVEFLRAAAVGPLLHGSRNPQVWRQIQAHLPQTFDRPKLALDKLQGLTDLYSKNREILLQDAAATPGDLSATSTPSSTTPPSSLGGATQPTGATGVTPGGVKFRVVQ